MAIPDSTADLLLVISLSASGLLLIVVAFLFLRLRGLSRTTSQALGGGKADIFESLAELRDANEGLRDDLGIVHGNTAHLRELMRDATTKVAIVRYDAFEDMGGGLSFSAAVLNERGSGLVFSAINGRQETRAYAKPIVDGKSDFSLSTEEVTAIEQAMKGVLTTGATLDDPGRRRGRRAS